MRLFDKRGREQVTASEIGLHTSAAPLVLAHATLRQIGTITPVAGAGTVLPAPGTGHRRGRVQRHAGPALQQDNSRRRSSLAACPDTSRASRPATFRSVTISAHPWAQKGVATRTFAVQAAPRTSRPPGSAYSTSNPRAATRRPQGRHHQGPNWQPADRQSPVIPSITVRVGPIPASPAGTRHPFRHTG